MMSPETFLITLQNTWQQLTPEAQAKMRPYIQTTCDLVASGATGTTATPALPAPGGCGCNKGGGACSGGSCSIPNQNAPGTVPMLNIPGTPPGCYDCEAVDPCLAPFLAFERYQMDPWSWLQLQQDDSDLVHVDKDVGAAPFVDIDNLSSNTAAMLAMEDAQQLAWIPGLLKIKIKFSDNESHNQAIGLQLFAGPRGLINLTGETALTKLGRAYKGEDFVCGDACYLVGMPKLLKCSNRVLPGPRALYVKVTCGALPDGVTVEEVSITVIKAGTSTFANCCSKHQVSPII